MAERMTQTQQTLHDFVCRSYTVAAHQDGAYHWAGKHFLSDLSGATQYRARVTAENDEVSHEED